MRRSFALFFCFIFSATFCFGQGRIVFHKKNSKRTFSMPYYGSSVVKMKNGKRYVGIMTANNDSTIYFRSGSKRRRREQQKEINKIYSNFSLTNKERHKQLMRAIYRDSLALNYDSIRSIRFALAFDNRRIPRVLGGSLLFLTCYYIGFTSFAHDTVSNPFHINPAIGVALFASGFFILYEATNKNIRTSKWDLGEMKK